MGRVGRDRREKIRKKREKRNKIKKEEAREEERKGFFRLKSTHSTIEIKARKKKRKDKSASSIKRSNVQFPTDKKRKVEGIPTSFSAFILGTLHRKHAIELIILQ